MVIEGLGAKALAIVFVGVAINAFGLGGRPAERSGKKRFWLRRDIASLH
jgi:hypothetical protein